MLRLPLPACHPAVRLPPSASPAQLPASLTLSVRPPLCCKFGPVQYALLRLLLPACHPAIRPPHSASPAHPAALIPHLVCASSTMLRERRSSSLLALCSSAPRIHPGIRLLHSASPAHPDGLLAHLVCASPTMLRERRSSSLLALCSSAARCPAALISSSGKPRRWASALAFSTASPASWLTLTWRASVRRAWYVRQHEDGVG